MPCSENNSFEFIGCALILPPISKPASTMSPAHPHHLPLTCASTLSGNEVSHLRNRVCPNGQSRVRAWLAYSLLTPSLPDFHHAHAPRVSLACEDSHVEHHLALALAWSHDAVVHHCVYVSLYCCAVQSELTCCFDLPSVLEHMTGCATIE